MRAEFARRGSGSSGSQFPSKLLQEAQLSQRGCALLRVVKKVVQGHSKLHKSVRYVYVFSVEFRRDLEIWVRGQSKSLKMAPFESLDTVSYSHSIATIAVSLAVSTQYTNMTDRHPTIHHTTA